MVFVLGLFVCVCKSPAADLTNYSIRLDHITYLTSNLDSLVRVFQRKGFTVTPGEVMMDDVARHFIYLPDGSYIELQTTLSTNPADWRLKNLATYGDHIAAVAFDSPEYQHIYDGLIAAGISVRPVPVDVIHDSVWSAMGIEGSTPLDILFVTRKGQAIRQEQPVRKIDWLIFAAHGEQDSTLRKIFTALDLSKRHEGWFDYWMMGDAEHRLCVRIGEPYNETYRRLPGIYIEENGIVFAY